MSFNVMENCRTRCKSAVTIPMNENKDKLDDERHSKSVLITEKDLFDDDEECDIEIQQILLDPNPKNRKSPFVTVGDGHVIQPYLRCTDRSENHSIIHIQFRSSSFTH